MPLPTSATLVTYPDGEVTSSGTVVHVESLPDGRSAVILDRTAFHPVDAAWPDQPADRGVLRWRDAEAPILDAVTGGIRDGEVKLGADLPVRMGTEGWTFVVAHLIDGPAPAVGAEVEVSADADHRAALSAGHTACHLASLALDAALADAWTKDVPADALGNPGFDALACQSSRIVPNGSVDVYRVGKSLRKRGFDPAALESPDAVAARANAHLAEWVASGAPVHIARGGLGLSDRRTWVCELPGQRAEIPCGGTHARSLADLGTVMVALELEQVEGGLLLTMTTTVSGTATASGK